ncbi:MAG: HAMP domain-containing histidine kinase, partial [Kangiellaceae bacterium]|nr:HAMP domain-containing histidine kinase [Kangiellaceae bacterium]
TLAWQAYSANTLHNKIAHKVLGEYAELAATEFSRRLMSDIGYRGYFQLVNQWKGHLDIVDNLIGAANPDGATQSFKSTDIPMCQMTNLASFYFANKDNRWHILDANCKPVELGTIKPLVDNFNFKELTDKPFAFIHSSVAEQPVSIVVAEEKIRNIQFGFVVNRTKLNELLEQSFQSSPLLPKALADGKANNNLLEINMQGHMGRNLLGTPLNEQALIVAGLTLSNEYSGIFRGHTINVGINKNNAEALIIGGLPDDNLPTIGFTILLTFIVFISSFIQLKKEHELNELRSDFVAQVSHELRTPLTQIRMFGEMLEQGKVRSEQESKHYLSVIVRESIRLNYLIENVLKYSRTTHAISSNLSLISIKPIIQETLQDFDLLLHHHQVNLDCQLEEGELLGDASSIKQTLSNLLDNALKYGPDGQTINIEGKVITQQKENFYSLVITDRGKGIPPEEYKNIWQPYYRLKCENHDATSGTGIGLYLVKLLMEEMEGEIDLDKEYAGGCRFKLLWPMKMQEITEEKT